MIPHSSRGFRWVLFCVLPLIGCEPLGNSTNLTDEPPEKRRDPPCQAGEVEVVAGHHEENFRPETAPGKVFDAREADFLNRKVKWGMITMDANSGDTDMCWSGGYVYTDKAWDASWDDHKDLDGPTRNSTAIDLFADDMTVTGLHFFNVHDGVRLSEAVDWVVEYNWGEYVRDDCIENDYLHSGRVYDSLFDGCYAGISTRPTDSKTDGSGEVVELDRVLLRIQAMPYSYEWETNEGIIDASGNPYSGSGIPYSHGSLFKMTDVDRNPHYEIKNSLFLVAHLTKPSRMDFPSEHLIDACRNNTIIWLGYGAFPGELPTKKFPECFDIVTGQEGRDLWMREVADWHARHPDVGAGRKPESPGDLSFPKMF